MVACLAVGFVLGLVSDGLFGKAYAKTESVTEPFFSKGEAFESVAYGSARSADYEIVYVYGKKYIVFSSGSDIEVLEY